MHEHMTSYLYENQNGQDQDQDGIAHKLKKGR